MSLAITGHHRPDIDQVINATLGGRAGSTVDLMTSDLQRRAAERRQAAVQILGDLDLIGRWAAHGEVHLVGSVALDLVVEPDIDLEIYCAAPDIGEGFTVLATSTTRIPGPASVDSHRSGPSAR